MISITQLAKESVTTADLAGFTNMFNNTLQANYYRFTDDQIITIPANKSVVVRFECSDHAHLVIEASNNNFATQNNWDFKTLASDEVYGIKGAVVYNIVPGPEAWKPRFIVENRAINTYRAGWGLYDTKTGHYAVEYDKQFSIDQTIRLDYQIHG